MPPAPSTAFRRSTGGSTGATASQKGLFRSGKKANGNGGRMRRGRTTTTTDVDARRPPLHHGCVRPAAATTHGHRRRRGAGRHPFCWGIGSELLLHALLGGAARRTAPVLACQWRVGRRAPTRRCVVRSSTGMHACMQKRAVDPMLRPRCAEGQGTGGRSLSVSASASPSSCMDDY